MGDAGLTGRKIIVDTYGGAAPHGGGAFSGKDPTKVDRSAAYAARYVAKNIVAAGLAERCQIQVAYAIGVAQPFSIHRRHLRHRARSRRRQIEELVREHFDLRPAAILRDLDLRRPIYGKTAAYGHFGRDDPDFTWERTDKADALRAGRRARRGDARPAKALRPSDEQAGRGLLGDRHVARRPRAATRSWPAAGSAGLELERSPRARAPRRRTSAAGRRRARRAARSSRGRRARARRAARARGSRSCSNTVSIGQPCGQRSGFPSRSRIRSTMSSLNVSPSSSACTCASAAV